MEKCFILCGVGTVSSLVSFGGCRLEVQKAGATLSFGEMVNLSKFQEEESNSQKLLQGEKDNKGAHVPHPGPLPSFSGHLSFPSFKLILMGNSIHILTRSEE